MPREPLSDSRPRAVAAVERDGKVLVIRRHLDGRVAELLLEVHHGGRTAFYYWVTGVEVEPALGGEEADGQNETNQHHPMWAIRQDLEPMGVPRPVPGKPCIPPDVWLTGRVAG